MGFMEDNFFFVGVRLNFIDMVLESMKETMEEKGLDKEYSDSYHDIAECIEYLKEIQSRYMEQNNITEVNTITHYFEHSIKKEE